MMVAYSIKHSKLKCHFLFFEFKNLSFHHLCFLLSLISLIFYVKNDNIVSLITEHSNDYNLHSLAV